jgi:hypothetical protein
MDGTARVGSRQRLLNYQRLEILFMVITLAQIEA